MTERYRSRVRAYGVDFPTDKFRRFVEENALVLQLTFGGAPMKLFAEGRSEDVDVYGGGRF